jgi:hypothetical protein
MGARTNSRFFTSTGPVAVDVLGVVLQAVSRGNERDVGRDDLLQQGRCLRHRQPRDAIQGLDQQDGVAGNLTVLDGLQEDAEGAFGH